MLHKIQTYCCLIITAAIAMMGCNSGDKPGGNDLTVSGRDSLPCDTCALNANYIIPADEASRMFFCFDSVYVQSTLRVDNRMNYATWIDSCYIATLVKFFADSASKYDGARFYYGSDEGFGDHPCLFVVPTMPGNAANAHNNDWNAKLIPSGCRTGYRNYQNNPTVIGIPMRERFSVAHRRMASETAPGGPPAGSIDSLSRGVWFNKCMFKCLLHVIQLYHSSEGIDGINIHAAAYEEKHSNILSQKYQFQSTIVITFTRTKDGVHQDVLEIGSKLYEKYYLSSFGAPVAAATPAAKRAAWVALNHGELCPNSCSVGD